MSTPRYLTWAGITAGKAQSFFSFIGGGDNYANFFSPDRKGFNEPLLLAYTASFGGGFTATISAESPGGVGASGGGTDANGGYFQTNMGPGSGSFNPSLITYGGQKWPDFVGALHVKQGWGEAQISGVIHNVNVAANGYDNSVAGSGTCGTVVGVVCDGQENKVGWALDAGVKINLQGWGGMFAPGDDFVLSGAYSQSAIIYSGINDGMWSENGQVNGNGQPMLGADAFFNPVTNQWSTPRAWSVLGLLEHHWTPTFYTDLEASILGVNWSNMGGGCNIASAGLPPRPGGGRSDVAQRLQLDCWRRPWLESGHQPQLRLRVDVSEHNPGSAERVPRHCLQPWRRGRGGVRARRLEGQRQRLCGPSPHHPLLLIASRSVETDSPGAKAPGFFVAP